MYCFVDCVDFNHVFRVFDLFVICLDLFLFRMVYYVLEFMRVFVHKDINLCIQELYHRHRIVYDPSQELINSHEGLSMNYYLMPRWQSCVRYNSE